MIDTDQVNSGLIQLVYVSAAKVEFTATDLDELLTRARETNTLLDVTGVLLFIDGTFFQVLEGPGSVVFPLYEKIESDPRHTNTLVVSKSSIVERNFGDWSMGFVADRDHIAELPGFVSFFATGQRTFLDLHGDSKRIGQVVEGFRRGRWRRASAVVQH